MLIPYCNIKNLVLQYTYYYVYLGSRGRAPTRSETLRKVVVLMTTYEEFMVILTVALLIVAILNLKNKK